MKEVFEGLRKHTKLPQHQLPGRAVRASRAPDLPFFGPEYGMIRSNGPSWKEFQNLLQQCALETIKGRIQDLFALVGLRIP